MSHQGQFKDSQGHYAAQKKGKRDRVTGSVTIPNTPVTLQGIYYTTGPFVAETILVCNGTTYTAVAQILDGVVPLTCLFSIAAGVLVSITPVYLPFNTAVNFNSDDTHVICTMGGWIP